MSFFSPLPSRDGKQLFVVGALERGELTRYDTKFATFAPFLSGISADGVSFSRDGQWVTYVSFPSDCGKPAPDLRQAKVIFASHRPVSLSG